MTGAHHYVIDLTLRDHVTGTAKASRFPRRFKTRAGADKAASRLGWVCRPDGRNATQEATATVVEVAK